MWAELSHPWQCCIEEAWAAYCAGSVPIGAVVTDAGGHVVSHGRSRNAELSAEAPYLHNNPLAHAEMNALVSLDYRQHHPPHSCVLYTTTEPCPLCLGAFYMSGVRNLRYASRDPYAGSVNLLGTTPYLQRKPITVAAPERSDLEVLIMALHVERSADWGAGPEDVVLTAWEAVIPRAVQLGRDLYASGELRGMREAGLSAAEMVARLSARL
jgi:tRNA(Arg) A34 adenosine deaminase TadA